jgi:hypothetical protein
MQGLEKCSLDMRSSNLCEERADMRKHLHRKLGLRIQVERQATKTLVKTMQHGLKAKTAEVTNDFLQGLKTTRREFKTQRAEVEAWA